MEPLSKLSLNNQIVSMRQVARRSKVHTINKLSREAKKLKEKKGSEEQVIKNKKKAERFINELMVIKKLNEDTVTKYALQNEIPTAVILNSTDITMETRARARLAGHKFVVDAVQKFRNKYPDWKSSIRDLLNDLGAKHRTKKKPNEKRAIKTKIEKKPKNVKKNNNEINANSKKSINTQLESEEALSEFEDTINKTDSLESDAISKEIHIENTRIKNISPMKCNISCNDKNNSLKFLVSNKTLVVKKNEKNSSECSKSIKSSQAEEVNVLDTRLPKLVGEQLAEKNLDLSTDRSIVNINVELEKKFEGNGSCKNYKKKIIMADDIKPVCETVDSFFMTADDKDYMSVYKPPPLPLEGKRPKLDYQHPPKEIFNKGIKVALIKNKQNYTGNRRERRQQEVEEPIDTMLHPSWEAKRKQKSLATFKGKKTTFDDDD